MDVRSLNPAKIYFVNKKTVQKQLLMKKSKMPQNAGNGASIY